MFIEKQEVSAGGLVKKMNPFEPKVLGKFKS